MPPCHMRGDARPYDCTEPASFLAAEPEGAFSILSTTYTLATHPQSQ